MQRGYKHTSRAISKVRGNKANSNNLRALERVVIMLGKANGQAHLSKKKCDQVFNMANRAGFIKQGNTNFTWLALLSSGEIANLCERWAGLMLDAQSGQGITMIQLNKTMRDRLLIDTNKNEVMWEGLQYLQD